MGKKRRLRARVLELQDELLLLRTEPRTYITGTIVLGGMDDGPKFISFPIDPRSGLGPVIDLPSMGYLVVRKSAE